VYLKGVFSYEWYSLDKVARLLCEGADSLRAAVQEQPSHTRLVRQHKPARIPVVRQLEGQLDVGIWTHLYTQGSGQRSVVSATHQTEGTSVFFFYLSNIQAKWKLLTLINLFLK